MKIAALLTCYNRVESTLCCLRRTVAQRLPADCHIDLYLVDDASPDNTGDRVQAWFSTAGAANFRLTVIRGSGNLFWCKGMRLAWDTAIASGVDYDFYLWINDDVVLKDNAIASLLRDFDTVGQGAAVLVGTFSPDERYAEASYGAIDMSGKVLVPTGSPQRVVGFLNGNLVLISRRAYAAVGPICGRYCHGMGDYDYSMQLRRRGVPFFASSQYSGICVREPRRYLTTNGMSIFQRISLLWKPKGVSLHDTILYKMRNFGVVSAALSVAHVIYLVAFNKIDRR